MRERLRTQEMPSQGTVSYGFRFEEHFVEPRNYERKKAHLLASMKQVLKPGENNVVLLENESGTDTMQRCFDKGVALYSSFSLANVYDFFVRDAHRNPGHDELADAQNFLNNRGKSNHVLLHQLLVLDALDTLQTEGYGIKVVFENGAKAAIPKPKEPAALETRRQLRREFLNRVGHTRSRNQQVITQLIGIDNVAKKTKGNTNVLAIFGTLHSNIPELLPNRIQERITYASSEPNYLTVLMSPENATPQHKTMQAIMNKLMHGDTLSPEEWEEFFVLEGLKSNHHLLES